MSDEHAKTAARALDELYLDRTSIGAEVVWVLERGLAALAELERELCTEREARQRAEQERDAALVERLRALPDWMKRDRLFAMRPHPGAALLEAHRKEVEALKGEQAALLSLLSQVEHVTSRNPNEGMAYGPLCGEMEAGHTEDCDLGHALHGAYPAGADMLERVQRIGEALSDMEEEYDPDVNVHPERKAGWRAAVERMREAWK